jgi:hypothetical protein
MDELRRRRFASQISRRFSRFAYPNRLYPVLSPLKERIRSRAPKDGSIGRALRQVETLRLECEPNWDATEGLELTLLVLVKPEFLPSSDVDDIAMQVGADGLNLADAADQLLALPAHSHDLVRAWRTFANALRSLLEIGQRNDTSGLVIAVDVDVMRTDEFTYDRYLNSVDLDLDYLSPPS